MEERNLDLVKRNEGTRDKFHTEVVRFELDQIQQVNIITKEIVQSFICDIEKIVRSIDAEVRNK